MTRPVDTLAHPRGPATTSDRNGQGGAQEGPGFALDTEEELLAVRHTVRSATLAAGFGLIDQTRVVTAASELARNAFVHGGGGRLRVDILHRAGEQGVRLTVTDQGPGIANVEAALVDGYTTGSGLGHGLGGTQRLMHEFEIHSAPGEGTRIITTRWAPA
ncbi:ATP-binding protein [Streptomyces sp. NPDC091272]|uniref:ATP-binding protein n=1 Tax=Streptomyces sp. NPDC091272 TaxID=3365981 RepID=UPI0037FBBAA4